MFKGVLSIAGFLFKRVFILFIIMGVGFYAFTNYKEVLRSAQLQTLSRLTPSFNYGEAFLNHPENLDVERLDEALVYHQFVKDLVPQVKAEAWHVIGFCYALKNESVKARAAFLKAQELNPTFFWTQYNLAVLAFNRGEYKEAQKRWMEALQKDYRPSVFLLVQSKVFKDIYQSMQLPPENLQMRLIEGHARAKQWVQLSMLCQARPEMDVCTRITKIDFNLF